MNPLRARLVRSFGMVALFLGAALAGTISGVLFAFADDLPQISALDDYTPSTVTRVLGRDGSVVGEFATERRDVVRYEQIPKVLRDALVASEDGDFWQHNGVDMRRIASTIVRRATGLQRSGGASTITQQLARKLFLTDEQTLERKIKEWLLAIRIEKRYTKEEILTMFCNKMYWGHGAYGVEAASQLYFGKSVSALTLDEAAMIAGIHQSNVRQSPYVNMAAATTRRNYALERMAANGYITNEDLIAAKKRPIVTRGEPARPPSIAPYFMEAVRTRLEERYGSKAVYESGLVVRTGLDPALQRAANQALDAQLRRLDKVRGFRRPTRNVSSERQSLESVRLPQWGRDPSPGDIVPAVVMGIEGRTIQVRVGKWRGTIDAKGYEWTKRRPDEAVKRGDVVDVKVKQVEAATTAFSADLDQVPELQGALVALDNKTGHILAMIGGHSFERSQFNRATQAMRQVGSLFKPFVFTAAIDAGYTTISELDDRPTGFDAGAGQPLYQPMNYDKKFLDKVSLRHALEDSRNVPTVGLMQALGPPRVIDVARALGITSPIPPFLSTAIGASEATLLEITSTYVAYANQGQHATPMIVLGVTDREGNAREENHPESREALHADTAYIVNDLLQGAIQHGTGQSAKVLNWPIGGKTGTTDDYTDAWFVGFDPDITLGVWIGYDQKKPIGTNMTGAAAALPVWIDVMKTWVDRRRAELPEAPVFVKPNNVVVVMIDGRAEVFIAGTEPGRHHH